MTAPHGLHSSARRCGRARHVCARPARGSPPSPAAPPAPDAQPHAAGRVAAPCCCAPAAWPTPRGPRACPSSPAAPPAPRTQSRAAGRCPRCAGCAGWPGPRRAGWGAPAARTAALVFEPRPKLQPHRSGAAQHVCACAGGCVPWQAAAPLRLALLPVSRPARQFVHPPCGTPPAHARTATATRPPPAHPLAGLVLAAVRAQPRLPHHGLGPPRAHARQVQGARGVALTRDDGLAVRGAGGVWGCVCARAA